VTTTVEFNQAIKQSTNPRTYRADIDGMRAFAVLMVLVFHFSLLPGAAAGFMGVDVFFVISGFLITTILKNQLDTGQFNLGTFYINRVRRLAPALLFVLLAVMCAGTLWLFPADLLELSKQVLAAQLYVANIYYWRNINYFGLGVHDAYLLHTWSLAVEEQFYLFYPVFLLFVHRHVRKHFWTAIVLGFIASFGLNVLSVGLKPEAAFYLLPTRAWELLAGALVPFVASKWGRNRAADELVGVLGAALVLAGLVTYRKDFHFPGFCALLPTMGTACLLLSGGAGTTVISRVLSWKPIVYMGQISYPLYLVHWPLDVFARQMIRNYSLHWRLGMFALSILMAGFIYHAVENPVRLKRVFAAKQKLIFGYATGVAVTLTAFATVQLSGGLPHRFPQDVLRLAGYADDKSPPLSECEFSERTAADSISLCRIGAADQKPTWLVYGDSHALATHAAFDEWLKLNGHAGFFIFRHGCPPLNGIQVFHDKHCFAFNEYVTRLIESRTELRDIALVSIWREAIEGLLSTSPDALLTEQESVQVFADGFSRTLRHLYELGRRVYVWEPLPGARQYVPRELARAKWEHRAADLEISRSEYLSTYRFFFDALNTNRKWLAATFSPSALLCATGSCAVEHDGIPLYFDNNHITQSSADYWVKILQRAPSPSQ
jgi:peptidoglycan/LPS O-acetylase OafA/YrhL